MSTVIIESSSGTRGRSSKFKRIVISERNYLTLKSLGYAGDSFNDVISKLLRIERRYQEMKKQQQEQQENNDKNSSSNNSDNGSELLSPPGPFALFEKQNKQQEISELVRLLRGKRRGKCCT
jgi:predicted CopG family antitoxin